MLRYSGQACHRKNGNMYKLVPPAQHMQIVNQQYPRITELAKRLWQRVSTDILSWGGDGFLVTVGQHHKLFEVDKLKNPASHEEINCLRSHFARYGIPDILFPLITDQPETKFFWSMHKGHDASCKN